MEAQKFGMAHPHQPRKASHPHPSPLAFCYDVFPSLVKPPPQTRRFAVSGSPPYGPPPPPARQSLEATPNPPSDERHFRSVGAG